MTSVADLASPNANRVMLIVPTYNEALNLPLLIPRILAIRDDIDVLVVDDGSPDGTGTNADELRRNVHAARVKVLHRATKSGRGGAVMAGFRQALADDRYAWFGEMDADQSHQPEELPAFLDAIKDADLVVGARDVPGGRIEGWGLSQKLWSRMSNRDHPSRARRAIDGSHERLSGLQPSRGRAPGRRRAARDGVHQPLGVGVSSCTGPACA